MMSISIINTAYCDFISLVYKEEASYFAILASEGLMAYMFSFRIIELHLHYKSGFTI